MPAAGPVPAPGSFLVPVVRRSSGLHAGSHPHFGGPPEAERRRSARASAHTLARASAARAAGPQSAFPPRPLVFLLIPENTTSWPCPQYRRRAQSPVFILFPLTPVPARSRAPARAREPPFPRTPCIAGCQPWRVCICEVCPATVQSNAGRRPTTAALDCLSPHSPTCHRCSLPARPGPGALPWPALPRRAPLPRSPAQPSPLPCYIQESYARITGAQGARVL